MTMTQSVPRFRKLGPRWCGCLRMWEDCYHGYCPNCGEHSTRREHTERDFEVDYVRYGMANRFDCTRESIENRWNRMRTSDRRELLGWSAWESSACNPNPDKAAVEAGFIALQPWSGMTQESKARVVGAWGHKAMLDARARNNPRSAGAEVHATQA